MTQFKALKKIKVDTEMIRIEHEAGGLFKFLITREQSEKTTFTLVDLYQSNQNYLLKLSSLDKDYLLTTFKEKHFFTTLIGFPEFLAETLSNIDFK